MRRRRPIDFELGLTADLVDGGLVGELADKLVRLDVDVLFAWRRLGGLDVAREELLGSLGALLLEPLGVVLALVGLEELVGVGARWDDHGCVGAAAEHALIVRDVLGEVVVLGLLAVGVFVLVL